MSAALLSRIDGVPMGSLLNVIGLGSLAVSAYYLILLLGYKAYIYYIDILMVYRHHYRYGTRR